MYNQGSDFRNYCCETMQFCGVGVERRY